MTPASFTVERYRSFLKPTTVELRPLTLLFGYNSAGKSALARALPLLAASFGGANLGPLALDATVARDAKYADLCCRLVAGQKVAFRLAWIDAAPLGQVEWRFRADEKRGHILDTFVLHDDAGTEILLLQDDPDVPGRFEVKVGGEGEAVTIAFDGLRPPADPVPGLSVAAADALIACSQRLKALKDATRWLGAVRAAPKRRFALSAPKNIDEEGRWTAEKLASDHRDSKLLFNFVAAAVERMFGQTLHVVPDGDEFALQLSPDPMHAARISIVDVGEGVSQVLPVLTLLGMHQNMSSPQIPLLILEQPEMHLHPRAERVLAEALCESAKHDRARLLVETHSENLLLFVQLQVAKGLLSPEDVSILWLDVEGGESLIRPVQLDQAGRPDAWPSGVFSEDVALARELLVARRGR